MNKFKYIYLLIMTMTIVQAMGQKSHDNYYRAQTIALNDNVYIRFGNQYIPAKIISIETHMTGDIFVKQYCARWMNHNGIEVSSLIQPEYIYKQ